MKEALKDCHTSPNTCHQHSNMPPAGHSSSGCVLGRETLVITHQRLFNIWVYALPGLGTSGHVFDKLNDSIKHQNPMEIVNLRVPMVLRGLILLPWNEGEHISVVLYGGVLLSTLGLYHAPWSLNWSTSSRLCRTMSNFAAHLQKKHIKNEEKQTLEN